MARFLSRIAPRPAPAVAPEISGDLARAQRAERLIDFTEQHEKGWFWETDTEGRITYLSEKVAKSLETFGIVTIGASLADVFKLDGDGLERARTLGFHLISRTAFTGYSVRGVKGLSDNWWSISGRPRTDAAGIFQGFVGSGTDLTQTRRHEAEITRLALFDGLTGLANRQRMHDSLDQLLTPKPGASPLVSLMLIDLDSFKVINDTLGHQTGDELLKQVAQRLLRVVGEAGLVGRLGGDEFQILLPGQSDRAHLSMLAKDIISSVSQPYHINGSPLMVSCSIGVAVAPEQGDDTETLVRNADLALYAAKADGRAVHRFYHEELLAGAQKRKQMEDDLRVALVSGQLHLVYQPIVCTQAEKIVGFESLLRWNHPVVGSISPAEFVPVAEQAGLIETIGDWVLRTATKDAARWPKGIRVAVNVSPIQFANRSFPATVISAIAEAQIAPEQLELEITESVFLGDEAASERMFAALKNIGVRLALDDFGTGYSSLGYLRNAPFDKIKIDQSFVRGAIRSGSRNAAIIQAIVTLAETLGMETTAEGVEHQDEIPMIRDLGCSHIQGYVYGMPMSIDDALARLQESPEKASAIGHKVSRMFRAKVLRGAKLRIHGRTSEVRIRNISADGVMIDKLNIPDDAIGSDVLIELLENELRKATIRWAKGDQIGLQFVDPLSTSSIKAVAPHAVQRSADMI